MKEADATSGSFYHFFPGKDDLLAAVVDRAAETLDREVFDAIEREVTDPFGRILALFAEYRRRISEDDFEVGIPIATLTAELTESHPRVRSRLGEIVTNSATRVRAVLEQAGERLPADVDRGALARMIVSTLDGAVLQSRALRSVAPFEAAASQIKNYLMLLTREAGRAETIDDVSDSASRRGGEGTDWRAW